MKLSWKAILTFIVGAIVAIGAWFTQNETAAIGLATMVLVSVFSMIMKWRGVKIGKFWANVAVVSLSFFFAVLKVVQEATTSFPPLPGFEDPVAFFAVIAEWLTIVSVYFNSAVTIAFVYYNTFWSKVQDYVADSVLKLPPR